METIRAKPFAAGRERILPDEKRAEKKAADAPGKGLQPTPIRISKLTRNVLVLVALIVVAYVMWAVPAAPIAIIGGFALALVLSFPVRGLSHLMPRGLAIFVSFMILAGLILVALLVVVPLLLQQLLALAKALPGLIANAEKYGLVGLRLLRDAGFLPGYRAGPASHRGGRSARPPRLDRAAQRRLEQRVSASSS